MSENQNKKVEHCLLCKELKECVPFTENVCVCNAYVCEECLTKWLRREKEDAYQEETAHIQEDDLICPHCGCVYDIENVSNFELGHTETKCINCGKKFSVVVERLYTTMRSIEEMPDDYEME